MKFMQTTLSLLERVYGGNFVELLNELPQFKGFWQHKFEKQGMSVLQQAGTKVVHLARLRDGLFAPVVEDNKNTGDIV